jgi:hypothetical protein
VLPIVSASFCPHPPALVPEVAAGAAAELDDLRAACRASITAATSGCDQVLVVGTGPSTRLFPAGACGSLAGYGVDVSVALGSDTDAPGDEPMPLSLTIGAWLLREAGWAGATAALSAEPAPRSGGRDGFFFGLGGERIALLVMGDGAPSRSEKAPGYLDPRADGFDAAVAAALASGDPQRLAALDTDLARSLQAAGWPAWESAARLLAGRTYEATLRYDAAPYGVGYFVADWIAAA